MKLHLALCFVAKRRLVILIRELFFNSPHHFVGFLLLPLVVRRRCLLLSSFLPSSPRLLPPSLTHSLIHSVLTHSLTHARTHSRTHSLTLPHSLTHSHTHSLTLGTGAALWKWLANFVACSIFCIWVYVCGAWAACGRGWGQHFDLARKIRGLRSISCIWVYICVAWTAFGSCLKGLDVVELAAGGPVLRDKRSTLKMACRFRGISCLCVYMCVARAAFGSCLT